MMSKKAGPIREHEITPDISLFGKLGARSRAFPMVVTELIDNSLDSWRLMPASKKGSKELKIHIDAGTGKDAIFEIRDNAGGMTEHELARALKVAHSDKEGAESKKLIGSFGFGLKSALMYIGPRFQIYSVSHTDPKTVWHVDFDRTRFEDKKTWSIGIHKLSLSEAAYAEVNFPDKHGTIIRVTNEKYKSASKEGILNRIRSTFAPLLPNTGKVHPRLRPYLNKFEKMEVWFNDDQVFGSGPFFEEYVPPTPREIAERKAESPYDIGAIKKGVQDFPAILPSGAFVEIPRKKVDGKEFWGIAGILDRGMAHNNHYGFDLVKNGRVIEKHVLDRENKYRRVGLMASNHNARIVGMLFFDDSDWKTDHQKTEFLKDSDDWKVVAEHVGKTIKPLLSISSNFQNPNKAHQTEEQEKKGNELKPVLEALAKDAHKAFRAPALKRALTSIDKSLSSDSSSKPPTISNTRIQSAKIQYKTSSLGANQNLVQVKNLNSKGAPLLETKVNVDHPLLKGIDTQQNKLVVSFLYFDSLARFICSERKGATLEDFFLIREALFHEIKMH